MRPGFSHKWILCIPPLLFLIVFYFYPLSAIFRTAFSLDGIQKNFGLYRLVESTYYGKIFWFTFRQALFSTLLTLITALPGTWVFSRYRFPGRDTLRSFTIVPFVLPTVVVAAAFQALLGRHGILNESLMTVFSMKSPPIKVEGSLLFILVAHVFYNYAVVFRFVGSFWAKLDKRLPEAAEMLGSSSFGAFRSITLPMLMPAILSASLLVFVFCFSSFGVILILGGVRFSTIETEIYRQAVHLFNLPMAAVLSIIQILFTFSIMWIYTKLQRKTSVPFDPQSETLNLRNIETWKEKLIVTVNLIPVLLFLGAPLVALIFRSFSTESGISLKYYLALFENRSDSIFFVPPLSAMINSLFTAGVVICFALILGGVAAIYLADSKNPGVSFLDPVFMLPLSTSAVTLGFGFIIALDKPPLNLRTSVLLTPIAHTLVALPFVVRSLLPAFRGIPDRYREAAGMLGSSPRRVFFTIDLPIAGKALIAGALFAFTVSLGEFGATVFTAQPQRPTIPVAIYRFLGQPGAMNYGQAMAMSSILMCVVAAGALFLDKFRIGDVGEF